MLLDIKSALLLLSTMADDGSLEAFGQTVVLTKRIQSVLRGYPEGTSVVKELVQNADDASATEVST